MTNVYLEKIAEQDEYKNTPVRTGVGALAGAGAGAALGAGVAHVLGKHKGIGVLAGLAAGNILGSAGAAISSARHNTKVDQYAASSPEARKAVDSKLISEGPRSLVGARVISGGIGLSNAVKHNKERYRAALERSKEVEKQASESENSNLKNTAAVFGGGAAAGAYGKSVYDRSRPIVDRYYNSLTGNVKYIGEGKPTAKTMARTVKKDVVSNIVDPAKKFASKAAVDYKVIAKKLAASSLARKITPLV